jgi:formate/nitrite transporter FocA (FNT family)
MWIYILVGVICNLIGALIMWFMMKPHEEGAIMKRLLAQMVERKMKILRLLVRVQRSLFFIFF